MGGEELCATSRLLPHPSSLLLRACTPRNTAHGSKKEEKKWRVEESKKIEDLNLPPRPDPKFSVPVPVPDPTVNFEKDFVILGSRPLTMVGTGK